MINSTLFFSLGLAVLFLNFVLIMTSHLGISQTLFGYLLGIFSIGTVFYIWETINE